jgi:hypothetical protein
VARSSNDEHRFRQELELEVEADLFMVESSRSAEVLAQPASEWLFDPTDAEREEVGLRNLLGAVEALDVGPDAGT